MFVDIVFLATEAYREVILYIVDSVALSGLEFGLPLGDIVWVDLMNDIY